VPIRIYALAKELKVDSKELVEICNKAGITGKGSALASLNDDEVEKVKAYMKGPPKKSAPAPAAPAPGPGRDAEPKPFTRDDYIAPAGGKEKIPVIDRASKPPDETRKKEEPAKREPKRKEPVINVAPLPEVKQPEPAKPPPEPKAQKPDIRLSKDAMTKKGPLEHLTSDRKDKSTKDRGKKPATAVTPYEDGAQRAAGKGAGRRGRGSKAPAAEGGRGLAGMASARADRKARRTRKLRSDSQTGGDESPQRRRRTLTRKGTNTAAPRKGKVALELPCTVRSFSEATGVSAMQVQRALMGMGLMVTINSQIDDEYVEVLAAELGVELEFKQHESLEDSVLAKLKSVEDDPADLQPRPPVVTFLGHVDHGKTSLLDYLIGINVVAGEAGGITQHIRAYQIDKSGRKIAFVDTPGHEAFTEMRARGANVTDVAVLVIAADDGIMPQTEEAISHAKAAEVPIVVALNKIDLPGADANRVMTQMTEFGLTPSEWGGDVEVIRTSAVTGEGMDDLLDTILTIADLHEFQANPKRHAMGTCLEAEQEGGRGVIAKVMVKNGTLKVGDVAVCGDAFGKVKAMYDTLRPRVRVKAAGPSMPVNITGFDTAPDAGEQFFVIDDIAQAREIAARRHEESRQQSLSGTTTRISFEEFQRRLEEGRGLVSPEEVVTLNLIIRADVRGSIEAIQKELAKLEHPEVQVKVLQASVGGITVADVTLAHASQAVIIGFNVIPDEAARALADDRQVEIRRYEVIYKVTDDIRAMLEGKLKPEEHTVELGQALVKQVFSISRVGAIAGCYVVRGTVERGCRIRVNRDGKTIGTYDLDSLRREKDDVKEVRQGMECGIKLAGFNDIKQDDVLESFRVEEVARTL
jgi:translation initiation factor IF-2